jgi:hypothetical protein
MCKAGLILGIRALEVAKWLLLSQEFFRAFLEPSL